MGWEAKISNVEVLTYRIFVLHEALITLAERDERHDPGIAHETITLFQNLINIS
jgi:hypothetical protein